MNSLNTADIVHWLRGKAKSFASMADYLEQTFESKGALESYLSPAVPSLSMQSIHDLLKVKKQRVGKLAKHFGVSETLILQFIENPAHELVIGSRGWVTICKPVTP